MFHEGILDQVPVWAFFIALMFITLLPIEVGQRIGERRRSAAIHESEGPVANVVAATLALLGFMVALTLGAATVRFDSRKEALIDDVSAIETAYRNAGLLPEPHKSEARTLISEYVGMRLNMHEIYADQAEMERFETRLEQVRASLWSHAEALAVQDRNSEIYALFASSLNEVFQVHNKRVILGAVYRIPVMVWVVLIIGTLITTLGVGFQFGLVGNRSPMASLMLALTFALVMSIIFDIDQPGKGFISVNQEPLFQLYERIKQP